MTTDQRKELQKLLGAQRGHRTFWMSTKHDKMVVNMYDTDKFRFPNLGVQTSCRVMMKLWKLL